MEHLLTESFVLSLTQIINHHEPRCDPTARLLLETLDLPGRVGLILEWVDESFISVSNLRRNVKLTELQVLRIIAPFTALLTTAHEVGILYGYICADTTDHLWWRILQAPDGTWRVPHNSNGTPAFQLKIIDWGSAIDMRAPNYTGDYTPADEIRGIGELLFSIWDGPKSSPNEILNSTPRVEPGSLYDIIRRCMNPRGIDSFALRGQRSLTTPSRREWLPYPLLRSGPARELHQAIHARLRTLMMHSSKAARVIEQRIESLLQVIPEGEVATRREFSKQLKQVVLAGDDLPGKHLLDELRQRTQNLRDLDPDDSKPYNLSEQITDLQDSLVKLDLLLDPDAITLQGRYTLLELIGSGGMASVYRAFDKVLDRRVAVKVMILKYAKDLKYVTRFKREARAAASVVHPNIVTIHDVGQDREGPFIVMEYLAGETLRDRIDMKRLTMYDVKQIAIGILQGLEHIHERNLVHRDINPRNIMVTTGGTVKIMDFGIAKGAADISLTASNEVLGTIAYMSPEQLLKKPLGPQSDIYSLGITIYEMLTRLRPFEFQDLLTMATNHLLKVPVPPRSINPMIPISLNAITMRALEKDPENRFQSAEEMRAELSRVKIEQPIIISTGLFAHVDPDDPTLPFIIKLN
jgi:tRNA A-37 threonylcarbamoyl transferase component Bud32